MTDEARQRAGNLYGSLTATIDPDRYEEEAKDWAGQVRLAEQYRAQDKQLITDALDREYMRGLEAAAKVANAYGNIVEVRERLDRLAQEARR